VRRLQFESIQIFRRRWSRRAGSERPANAWRGCSACSSAGPSWARPVPTDQGEALARHGTGPPRGGARTHVYESKKSVARLVATDFTGPFVVTARTGAPRRGSW